MLQGIDKPLVYTRAECMLEFAGNCRNQESHCRHIAAQVNDSYIYWCSVLANQKQIDAKQLQPVKVFRLVPTWCLFSAMAPTVPGVSGICIRAATCSEPHLDWNSAGVTCGLGRSWNSGAGGGAAGAGRDADVIPRRSSRPSKSPAGGAGTAPAE